jgi:hypothetical protein
VRHSTALLSKPDFPYPVGAQHKHNGLQHSYSEKRT